MKYSKFIYLAFLSICFFGDISYSWQSTGLQNPEKSVFMIVSFKQGYDYVTPWKREDMSQTSGTGFLINNNMILTNAHNVSNVRFVQIIKENVAKLYQARVVFVGHDCDLAVLAVDDNSFYEDTAALDISGLPKVNSTVSTYGFPMGGDRISVTEGVVSRIETDVYAHSAADAHLVIQTDAAINPGNSGGPVIQDGKVVGVAFQGLQEADNIGYMIPTTVIEHFLEDIEDGKYDSFGSLGVMLFPGLHNDSYRKYLKIPDDQDGIVVLGTLMNSSVEPVLKHNDVITKIEDYNIDNDGMIFLNGMRLSLTEVIESRQIGETVDITFYHDGELKTATVTVALNRPVFEPSRIYDRPPPYVCFAGLVFVPASRNFLETWGPRWPREIPFYLKYLLTYSQELNKEPERKEYVVLSEVMADEINSYANQFMYQIVEEINGKEIFSLEDVNDVIHETEDDFYTFKFMGDNRILTLNKEKAMERNKLILQKYDIPKEAYLEEQQ